MCLYTISAARWCVAKSDGEKRKVKRMIKKRNGDLSWVYIN